MVHTNAVASAARRMVREDAGQFTETGSEGVYGKVAWKVAAGQSQRDQGE